MMLDERSTLVFAWTVPLAVTSTWRSLRWAFSVHSVTFSGRRLMTAPGPTAPTKTTPPTPRIHFVLRFTSFRLGGSSLAR